MIVKATKAAHAIARRHRHRDDRYELSDMVQDGCLAEIKGRSAWYGVIDGLRHWLGQRGRIVTVPLDGAMREGYFSDPMRRLIAAERLDAIFKRLDRHPKRRSAVLLRYEEHKPVRQIGAILGLSDVRVAQLIRRPV